jgi:hypothetical protein
MVKVTNAGKNIRKNIKDPLSVIAYGVGVFIFVRTAKSVYGLSLDEFISGDWFSLLNKLFLLAIGLSVASAALYFASMRDGKLISMLIIRIFIMVYNLLLCIIYFTVAQFLNQSSFSRDNWICGAAIVAVSFLVVSLLDKVVNSSRDWILIPRLVTIMLHFGMIADKYIKAISYNVLPMFWGELSLLLSVSIAAILIYQASDSD